MTEEEYKMLQIGDYINDHKTGHGVISKLENGCITVNPTGGANNQRGFGMYKNWGDNIIIIRGGKIIYATAANKRKQL